MATNKDREKTEAIEALQPLMPHGTKVFGVLRSESRSGMSRQIDFYVMHNGGPRCVSSLVAKALGEPTGKSGAVRVGGTGMDMLFACVHALSYLLHGGPSDPRWVGKNDNPSKGIASGYTLKHEWQ